MNVLKGLLFPAPVTMQRALSTPRVLTTPRKLNDFSQFYVSSNKMYQYALREMNAGRKSSHWIWYIFPQLALHGYSVLFTLDSDHWEKRGFTWTIQA
eukprot:gene16022-18297_t